MCAQYRCVELIVLLRPPKNLVKPVFELYIGPLSPPAVAQVLKGNRGYPSSPAVARVAGLLPRRWSLTRYVVLCHTW